LMDLRLHMPRPDVVIVRVSGAVDPVTAPVLAALVGKQLLRMPHVVLDLGEVSVLGPQGLTVLLMLYQEAMARGVELQIVGVERDAVRRPLHARGLAQLVRFDATVDAVVASLPLPVRSRVGSRRA
jgi:anti-anti-sigma factor